MKTLFTFLFISLTLTVFAQSPKSFNYQAVARDAGDVPMTNTSINVRFTLHNSTPTGAIVYQETQSVTTNQFGLFTSSIGIGTAVSGNFSSISWGNGNKYLQVELNLGSGYIDMGTSQLLSVPYALMADSVKYLPSLPSDNWGSQVVRTSSELAGDGLAINPLKINQNGATTGQVLKWNGSSWTPSNDANGGGTVTNINTGTGLSGGPITSSGTISLANTGVTAGSYGTGSSYPVLTVNSQGQITVAGSQSLPTSLPPNGTAGGDLSGTYPNPTVTKLQNRSVSNVAPAVGQILKWNGNLWIPAIDSTGSNGWGTQTIVSRSPLSGGGVIGDSLKINAGNEGDVLYTNSSGDAVWRRSQFIDGGGGFKGGAPTTWEILDLTNYGSPSVSVGHLHLNFYSATARVLYVRPPGSTSPQASWAIVDIPAGRTVSVVVTCINSQVEWYSSTNSTISFEITGISR